MLPEVLLEKIFSFLNKTTLCKLQLVCREWRGLMLQFIWHTVEFRDMKEGDFRRIERLGRHIRWVRMNCDCGLTFKAVFLCCPNLTKGSFELGGYDGFTELIEALACSPSTQFSTLDIAYDWPLDAPYEDPFESFPELESIILDLGGTIEEEDHGELTTCYIPGIKNIILDADFVEAKVIKEISSAFPNLVTLEIKCEGISEYDDLRPSEEVNFSNLEQLTLNTLQEYSMTFSEMFGKPKTLVNLSYLDFNTGVDRSSQSLDEIFSAKWDNLEYLEIDLSGTMSRSIALNNFPNLTTLSIMLGLTPEDVPGVDLKLEYLSSLVMLPKLKYLSVEGELADNIFSFTTLAPNLHSLTLNGAYNLGPNFLRWLIYGLSNLQSLSITENSDEDDLFQPDFSSAIGQVELPQDFTFPLLRSVNLPDDTPFESWVGARSPNTSIC